MKVLIFLLFIALAFNGETTYSIDALLDYLQESGYYEIIYQVKKHFGDDVAIDFCEGIVRTTQCEEVVKVYMSSSSFSSSGQRRCPKKEIEPVNPVIIPKPSDNFIKEIINLLAGVSSQVLPVIESYISFILKYYGKLIKVMTEKGILKLIRDFITKYGNKNVCIL